MVVNKIKNQFWEKTMSALLDSIRDGLELVVDKTEEYGKIGKLKVDIFGIKRNIEKQFTELGGRVYELMTTKSTTKIAEDEEVKKAIETVKGLEVQLKDKELEIDKVKTEKEVERRERQESRKKEAQAKETAFDSLDDEPIDPKK